MSPSPAARSADVGRLIEDGYNVHVRDGHILMEDVPYVDPHGKVRTATLVSTLSLAGEVTQRPDTHVVFFTGETPHDSEGVPLPELIHQRQERDIAGVRATMSFSRKPPQGYEDYYMKMSTYAAILEEHAQALDPAVTARTFAVTESEDDAVFIYHDTATGRAQISHVNAKLAVPDVAIVGLGGTGAYILDMIAKCPIERIHLYDGDSLLQHNAFRSPGAASIDQLRSRLWKVEYYAETYSRMRRGVVPHSEYITGENIGELETMQYVFVAVDDADARREIVAALEGTDIPFVDVGMGIEEHEAMLGGTLRTVESRPETRDDARSRLPLVRDAHEDEYGTNIQVVELNALNAALAVVRWKKSLGFYRDYEGEFFSAYEIDGNTIVNDRLGQ